MRRALFVVLFCGMCVGSGSAMADWQYTTWGMTPDEVVEASGGTAQPTVGEPNKFGGSTELLTAPYSAGKFRFEAEFFFSDDEKLLDAVGLDLLNVSECGALALRVVQRYGKPDNEVHVGNNLEVRSWRDPSSRIFINAVREGKDLSEFCSLAYGELADEESGL